MKNKENRIKKPDHYNQARMETWDAIFGLFGYAGLASSVVRYVCRFEHKDDPIADLMKAREYIDKMIVEKAKELELAAKTEGRGDHPLDGDQPPTS